MTAKSSRFRTLFRSKNRKLRKYGRSSRRLLVEGLEDRRLLATYNPANVTDLIADINTANSTPADDVIDLGGGKFTLTSVDNSAAGNNGLPVIANAASAGTLAIHSGTIERDTVTGTPQFRIPHIKGGANLSVNSATISGGIANIAGPGTGFGGGFLNEGTLILTDSTISGNSHGAGGTGGGIYNSGTLFVTNTTLSGNVLSGIINAGTATVNNSILTSHNFDFLVHPD